MSRRPLTSVRACPDTAAAVCRLPRQRPASGSVCRKSISGGVACAAMIAAFGVSLSAVLAMLGHARRARSSRPSTRGSPRATCTSALTLLRRPARVGDDPGRHRHRLADPHLLDGLHARRDRQRVRAVLLVPEPVCRVHAGAGARRELPGDVRRVGGRRPLLVSADRLLVPEAVGDRRRQEGVRRQPHRRLRVHPRHAARLQPVRHARLPGRRQRRSPRCRRRPARASSSIATLLLFIGATGKSAQIPLYSGCRTRWKARRRSRR